MAANGIRVRIFDALRPTPELSFAVMHYGATAGINITASHNPREYNGYKVYWSDGAQLPPQHAAAVAAEMGKLDIFHDVKLMSFEEATASGLVEVIGAETDEAFLENVMAMSINKSVVEKVADEVKIVYTPFHGAGYKLVPEALRRLGVKHLYPEPQQMVIDGNFPTVVSPNPENPEGFYLAVDLAKEVGSDLIIGTDPDSDRVGTMVRGKDGEYRTITGNQMGVLLLDYIITARREAGTLPANAAFLKTIVTTNMGREIAEKNGVHVDETFTGFKFMAEKLAEYKREGSYDYILAYEESYGYMMGDYVRDKDAVTASMMIAEMAAYYFSKGMTLADALEGLYEKYGWFMEKTLNLVMPGLDGLGKMKELMASLRAKPPREIGGASVLGMRDYQNGTVSVAALGVGAVLMLLLNDPKRNPLINLGAGLWDLYNNVTGLLSDVLSYIRLFAIGLSGGVLALVFNTLAAGFVPEGSGIVVRLLVMIPILLIGHGINLFMSTISSFVHPLRLTFVEFYKNAGFEMAPRNFDPIRKMNDTNE